MPRISRALPLLLVAVACGGAPAAEGPATLHALDTQGHAVTGVVVSARDGDGRIVALGTTDETGTVVLTVPDGGSLTARYTQPATATIDVADRWFTILDVSGGDDLTITTGPFVEPRVVTVTWPPVPAPPPGESEGNVELRAACHHGAGAAGSGRLRFDDRCPDQAPLVASVRAGSGSPYAYLVTPEVDLRQSSIALTGSWRPYGAAIRVEATDVNEPVGAHLDMILGGYAVTSQYDQLEPAAAHVTASLPRTALGDRVVVTLSQGLDGGCRYIERFIRRSQRDVQTASFALADQLPAITAKTIDDHEIAWSGGGGGSRVRLDLFTQGPERGQWWTVVAPPGTDQVSFPFDAGFIWPEPGNQVTVDSLFIEATTTTRWPSYAEVRNHDLGVAADYDTEARPIDTDFEQRTSTGAWWSGCLGPGP